MKEREKNKKETKKKVRASKGIVESLSSHPFTGGLVSVASGISGVALFREAISISQNTSYNEGLIIVLFGSWLAGTGALTISKSVEKVFGFQKKNKRTRRLLSTIFFVGSLAGFYEGSQVIDHNIYVASQSTSNSVLTSYSPKIDNATEIITPPFDTPFTFVGRYIAPRTYSPSEWGNIVRWQPYIKDAFSTTGLDVTLGKEGVKPMELMEAILWLESRGNPYALSPEGATGGFQVMPRDGVSGLKYGSLFADRPETWRLFDPETNAYWGAKILNDKIIALKSVRAGIMSYGQQGIGTDYYDLAYALYQKILGQ